MVCRVAHAEHPLIAAYGTNAAADLIRQGLKREPVIGRRERRTDAIAGPFALLQTKERVNRLLEAAMQKLLVTLEWDEAVAGGGGGGKLRRQMKPVNRVEKEQRANAFVKIVALPAEGVEFRGGGQEFFGSGFGAKRVQR